MKLIKKLDTKRERNGIMVRWALFLCEYCDNEINMQNSRNAKLNLKQVQQIRSIYNNIKIEQKLLGKIFNISTGQINNIVNNRSWREL